MDGNYGARGGNEARKGLLSSAIVISAITNSTTLTILCFIIS